MQFKKLACCFFGMWVPLFLAPPCVQAATTVQADLVRKCIVIDAGHGGVDSGARSRQGDMEKDINLKIAEYLRDDLQQIGISVVMTRNQDIDLATQEDRANKHRHRGDLRGRLLRAKSVHYDAFVSIHCNADPSPVWRGAHVLYKQGDEKSKELAEIMMNAIREHLLPTQRDIKANQSLYLLKRLDGPAVLVEVGFITHPEELRLLKQPRYQKIIAYSLYEGLMRYFNSESTPSQRSTVSFSTLHG